jgi:hypothetical protein
VLTPTASILVKLLEMLGGERRHHRELTTKALSAINAAVVATRKYEAAADERKRRDKVHEAELGGLWQDAAIATREVNMAIAMRLQDKSALWFNSFEWSPAEMSARKVDWASIQRQIEELMRP